MTAVEFEESSEKDNVYIRAHRLRQYFVELK